jgi:hypothetical protein
MMEGIPFTVIQSNVKHSYFTTIRASYGHEMFVMIRQIRVLQATTESN